MAVIDDIRAKFKGAGFEPHVATKLAEAFALVISSNGAIAVKEGGSTVSSSATTLDFGTGFDVSESPAGEVNVFLNAAEVWDTLTNGTTPSAGKIPVYQADGTVAWETPSGGDCTCVGELLVADGVSPPEMLTDDDEIDFLYEG